MLVNEIMFEDILLEDKEEYDLFIAGKYLEKGPDKGLFNKGRKGTIKRVVKQIQKFLNAKGYSVGKVDGWYGKKTANAVRKFQKDNNLKPDGDVGRNTLTAMIQKDEPALADKPASAKLKDKEYPKDYIEQQYKKLKKEPDSAEKLFAVKPDMTDAMKATLQGIQKAMNADQGDDVKISSFGTFVIRKKKERIGRNPKTGQEVPITARSVVTFRASNVLKSKVNLRNKMNTEALTK